MVQAIRQNRKRRRSSARRSLGLLLALLLFTMSPLSGVFRTAASADEPDTVTLPIKGTFIIDSTRQMLDDINDLRANDAWYWNSDDTEIVEVSELSALVYDYKLERIAMQRAAELAIYYSHTRPNGASCNSAYTSEFNWYTKAENITYGYSTASSAFTAWAEADEPYAGQGHRRNMLNKNIKSVGIGCFECGGVRFWVQEFSNRITGAAADPLTSPVNVEAIRTYVNSPGIGGQIQVLKGESVALSEISFRVRDSYTPYISVPCYVTEDAFSIADTSIARISNGRIEGLLEGETTLTATVGGLTASALLTVTEDSTAVLELDTPVNVNIAAGETKSFSFTPSETGYYSFYSSGAIDTCGYLYDSDMVELAYNDDGGAGYNFSLSYVLTEGAEYFYGVRLCSASSAGSTTVTLEKASAFSSAGFTYTVLSDGTANIIDCSLTGDVVIPGELDGHTVAVLAAELFRGRSDISSVAIPDGVTGIDARTFCGCSALTEVTLPAGLTSVGVEAFSGCVDLTDVCYFGTQEQWEAISVAENNGPLELATLHCVRLIDVAETEHGTVAVTIGGEAAASSLDGATVDVTATPDEGYALASLSVTANGEDLPVENDQFTMPNADVTVTASFTLTTYTVSWLNADGSLIDTTTVEYGGTAVHAVPTREGWYFVGWYTDDTLETRFDPDTAIVSDLSLYAAWAQPDFVLPAALTEIGEEAFAGAAFTFAKLPERAVSIGPRAFASSPNLAYVYIPADVTAIDASAFEGVEGMTILGVCGSRAESYAEENGMGFLPLPDEPVEE